MNIRNKLMNGEQINERSKKMESRNLMFDAKKYANE